MQGIQGLGQILIAQALVCGVLGSVIASGKNAAGIGFILGLLFGPLGLIAAFVIDNREKCAACGTRVDQDASICPQCSATLTGLPSRRFRKAEDVENWECRHCGAKISRVTAYNRSVSCPACGKRSRA